MPVIPRGRSGTVRLLLNYLSFVLSGIVFGSWLLRGRRFDVQFVYCTTPVVQGFVALWFKRLNGAPLVLWVQDIWPRALAATGYITSLWLLDVIARLVNRLYRGSDLILAQSHSFVRLIAPMAGGRPVEFFPNPGEHPVSALPQGQLAAGKFNLVFAGNIGRAQGVQSIVDAAELLADRPDIVITLFGSGSMKEWMAREITRRGIGNVTLAGRVAPEQMPSIYAECSGLLLSLVDDPDVAQTVPSKVQSYFGAGRPIIAAVNGEAAKIVDEAGAGVTCPAENPQALAAAVRRLADMPDSGRREMGQAALRYFASHYEPTQLARHLFERLRTTAELSRGWGSSNERN